MASFASHKDSAFSWPPLLENNTTWPFSNVGQQTMVRLFHVETVCRMLSAAFWTRILTRRGKVTHQAWANVGFQSFLFLNHAWATWTWANGCAVRLVYVPFWAPKVCWFVPRLWETFGGWTLDYRNERLDAIKKDPDRFASKSKHSKFREEKPLGYWLGTSGNAVAAVGVLGMNLWWVNHAEFCITLIYTCSNICGQDSTMFKSSASQHLIFSKAPFRVLGKACVRRCAAAVFENSDGLFDACQCWAAQYTLKSFQQAVAKSVTPMASILWIWSHQKKHQESFWNRETQGTEEELAVSVLIFLTKLAQKFMTDQQDPSWPDGSDVTVSVDGFLLVDLGKRTKLCTFLDEKVGWRTGVLWSLFWTLSTLRVLAVQLQELM